MQRLYNTRRLVVFFSCSTDRISCIIYRKGQRVDNWTQLQSHSMKRPGFKRLDEKSKIVACRMVLKAMRHRMSNSLKVTLENVNKP
jgi:hypothetical protein